MFDQNRKTGNKSEESLPDLQRDCQKALGIFKRSGDRKVDCSSCTEILHRAANRDKDALLVILDFTRQIVKNHYPPDMHEVLEDLQNEVVLKIINKIPEKFKTSEFPQYVNYVKLVIRTVSRNMRRFYSIPTASLDDLLEQGIDFSGPFDKHPKDDPEIICERLLALLNPLEKEVIERRYFWGKKPKEILGDLIVQWPELTVQEIYKITENALLKLRRAVKKRGISPSDIERT